MVIRELISCDVNDLVRTRVVLFLLKIIKSWLNEIQQSDWLVVVVENSVDHTVKNHVLKTIDNDINRGLLSFRHLKMF